MRTTLWIAALVLLVGTGLVWSQQAAREDTESLKGQAAPDFALKTLDSKDVKLSAQKGKVVLVDLWATWCPPCRKSLPHIQELSGNKDLAEKGLVVWAVNSKEKADTASKFVQENKYTFTVPMDAEGQVGKAYLVRGIPTTVIIGRDGVIKDVFIGFGPDTAAAIDAAVNKALAEK